jgi:hypothetical protein
VQVSSIGDRARAPRPRSRRERQASPESQRASPRSFLPLLARLPLASRAHRWGPTGGRRGVYPTGGALTTERSPVTAALASREMFAGPILVLRFWVLVSAVVSCVPHLLADATNDSVRRGTAVGALQWKRWPSDIISAIVPAPTAVMLSSPVMGMAHFTGTLKTNTSSDASFNVTENRVDHVTRFRHFGVELLQGFATASYDARMETTLLDASADVVEPMSTSPIIVVLFILCLFLILQTYGDIVELSGARSLDREHKDQPGQGFDSRMDMHETGTAGDTLETSGCVRATLQVPATCWREAAASLRSCVHGFPPSA